MTPHYIPVPDALSSRFWQGTRERKLMIQRCSATQRPQWYPRTHSIHAPGAHVEWVQASGRGTLFTWSAIHRGNGTTPTPYVCVVVELEEGVLFTSTLRDVAEADIRIGMPLEVDYDETGTDFVLPYFKPAGSA
jgi:uncharacterized OB-fold protein